MLPSRVVGERIQQNNRDHGVITISGGCACWPALKILLVYPHPHPIHILYYSCTIWHLYEALLSFTTRMDPSTAGISVSSVLLKETAGKRVSKSQKYHLAPVHRSWRSDLLSPKIGKLMQRFASEEYISTHTGPAQAHIKPRANRCRLPSRNLRGVDG